MSMKEFNYKRAWREAAQPLFEELPEQVLRLFDRVKIEGLNQGQDLNCIWPERTDEDRWLAIYLSNDWSGSLQEAFAEIDSETLAHAAAVIPDYGHWHSNNDDQTGAYWKFSNYADQTLRTRLGVSNGTEGNGVSIRILEGMIRVGFSSKWSWPFEEVAPATEENLNLIRRRLATLPAIDRRRTPWDAASDRAMAKAKQIRDELVPKNGSPFSNLVRAGEIYMEEKVIKCKDPACGHVRPVTRSYEPDAVYASEVA